jgi:hypothetical protein
MNILIAAGVDFSETSKLWAYAACIRTNKTSTNLIGVVNLRQKQ